MQIFLLVDFCKNCVFPCISYTTDSIKSLLSWIKLLLFLVLVKVGYNRLKETHRWVSSWNHFPTAKPKTRHQTKLCGTTGFNGLTIQAYRLSVKNGSRFWHFGRTFDVFLAHLFWWRDTLIYGTWVLYKKYDDATVKFIKSPVLSVSLPLIGVVAFWANYESHSEHLTPDRFHIRVVPYTEFTSSNLPFWGRKLHSEKVGCVPFWWGGQSQIEVKNRIDSCIGF